MNVEDAVYRVFSLDGGSERFRGTAFAIAPNWFMTCSHLFCETTDNDKFFLRGPSKHGDIGRIDWHHHPEMDCATGILEPGTDGVDTYLPILLRDVTSDLGELRCMGFIDTTSSLQEWTDQISGTSLIDGWVALQNTLSEGVSGGPVLAGDRVIALVRADNQRTNQKYVLPLTRVFSWIESKGFRASSLRSDSTSLAQVPIRPPVRAADISDAIIRIFASHLPDQSKAAAFVGRAMDASKTANAEGLSDGQILLHPSDLSFAGPVPSVTYWASVLLLAAERSRRTVAALFLIEGAPEPKLMADEEGAIYSAFLNWLIHPKA